MVPLEEFVTSQFFQKLCRHNAESGVDVKAVRPGESIYVRYWRRRLPGLLDALKEPAVVVSNFHDRAITDEALPLLDHPRLLHWYGVNAAVPHPKLTQIPLALDATKLKAMANCLSRGVRRESLLYLNFKPHNAERRAALAHFADKPYARVVAHDKRNPDQYYADLYHAKFALCPPGGGEDTYRIWETLALGTIPVVRRSFLAPLLSELPVLQVGGWDEVTEDLLCSPKRLAEAFQRCHGPAKLTQSYWLAEIGRHVDG